MLRPLPTCLLLCVVFLGGCTLCWPRGGSMIQCGADDDDAVDDDDVADDDDSVGDDDDTTAGDDDDSTFDCLSRRTRPGGFDFEFEDAFGYGTLSSDTADLPFCWFGKDVITQITANMSSAGATHGHERVEWDVIFYGEVVETVRIDINGTLNFEYQSAHNPNNSCEWYSWDSPAVAGFWDHLNMTDDGAGEIRYDVVGEEPDRIAVVWWDGLYHGTFPGDPISFQIHLFEYDHHIEVHYLQIEQTEWDVNFGRSATVGLLHEQATLWSCNENALNNGTVLAYWPPE